MDNIFGYSSWENSLTGEGGTVNDWVLTPQGKTTIDTVHTWDKGNPDNESKLVWNDLWYWTE